MERTYRSIVPVPADVRTGSGGVDAVASAGAFAGIRTRTGCVLGALPLPVGLRKHVRIPPLRGRNIRTVHNRSGHSCRILALMLAVDAHTATRGMTGITGAEPPCSSRPFPHPVGRLTRDAVAHVSGNLCALGGMGRSDSRRPLRRGLFASSWNDGRRRYPRVRRTNGGADHRTRIAWSWLPRRELPTGMESYRAVYGNRTRIISLED